RGAPVERGRADQVRVCLRAGDEATATAPVPGYRGPHPLTPSSFGRGSSPPGPLSLRERGNAQPADFRATKTRDEVVVHHADGLHERIADRRTDEAEAALDQGVAHGVGFARARGQLAQATPPVLLGYASHEGPEEHAEAALPLLEREKRPRVGH